MSTKPYRGSTSIAIFLISVVAVLAAWHIVLGATNIDSANRYAWNDIMGWIDFYVTNTATVYSNRLEGYASSSVGYVALNCNSTPNGDICATSDFKVSNDGTGNLSSWAWNDGVGWISFCGGSSTSDCPGTISYQVVINSSSGDWSGWGWNETAGWISFCGGQGTSNCPGSVSYYVKTSWFAEAKVATLVSSVYDAQAVGGVALNAVLWQGTQPTGTSVKFQIASGNCSNGATNPPTCSTGTWTYRGPDGTDTTHYVPSGPNIPVTINAAYHNNHRYFRYKTFLYTNTAQTLTPTVEDVILNWSY